MPAECTAPGCPRRAVARGLCRRHYSRVYKGRPLLSDRDQVAARLGEPDGHGRYGVLDGDGERLLCHECGRWYVGLSVHSFQAHGLTAAEYRAAHGLPRRLGLIGAASRAQRGEAAAARVGSAGWQRFEQRRDPVMASHARERPGQRYGAADLVAQASSAKAMARRRPARIRTCIVCGATWCIVPDSGSQRDRTCGPDCERAAQSARSRTAMAGRYRDPTTVEEQRLTQLRSADGVAAVLPEIASLVATAAADRRGIGLVGGIYEPPAEHLPRAAVISCPSRPFGNPGAHTHSSAREGYQRERGSRNANRCRASSPRRGLSP